MDVCHLLILCNYIRWVWTSWLWQLSDKWPYCWMRGWALGNCIVCWGTCHWSRQQIWGQAWTERRWGAKYLNNLTRKYEIFLIIVYIAKTWEPNRSGFNWDACNSTTSETERLLPESRRTTGTELYFDRDQSPDPKFYLTTGGEKGRGGIRLV